MNREGMTDREHNPFDLTGRVAAITGGAGLLGEQHGRAIAAAGGIPILVDIQQQRARESAAALAREYGVPAIGRVADITKQPEIEALRTEILAHFGRVDILINNAANNPKMEASTEVNFSRLENFPLAQWEADIAVGLTGAFLCSKVFGSHMANNGGGVIVNVASDLALIAPDQRIYRQSGVSEQMQPVKPVTYSVVKSALVGLTRYLASYWADKKVRVNAISPGGVYNGQAEDFVARLTNLIPLGRMAAASEYQGAIVFLCSDASSYMTGTNLVVDGGRSCW
jgi:NAD(P)-dependent dehydrogenase (short-subunit alcohol dehydrogenase family)